MSTPDKQLSAEQSQQVAETIREEIARRRISRQTLAEQAKLSVSTLEKVLGGRRPFTLATTVRLEQALGVSLRKLPEAITVAAPANGGIAPDSLGSYSRRAVARIEGAYITVRPSFGEQGAVYAYRTEIAWDEASSSLGFREGERQDADYRVITVSRPRNSGEMYGIITTLLAGRGSLLTPVAAPIAFLPIKNVPKPSLGRVSADDASYALYREHLRRTIDEPFAIFLPG